MSNNLFHKKIKVIQREEIVRGSGKYYMALFIHFKATALSLNFSTTAGYNI
jgi:hypothetical protein